MTQLSTDSIGKGSLRAWILAIRPKTLPVGAAPILVGLAIAFSIDGNNAIIYPGLLCLSTALLLQILSNLANDYFDFKKGADTKERIGPPRAMQMGLITSGAMKKALVIIVVGAVVSGATLVLYGGWVYLFLGVLAIASAVLYTAGPFPLGYNGLGDLFVFIFFGPVAVMGTIHICTEQLPFSGWLTSLAMGPLSMNLLTVNNIRDEQEDKKHGKKTLIVRFGRNFGLYQYGLGYLVALSCACAIAILNQNPFQLAPLALTPLCVANFKQLQRHQQGPQLNNVLAKTAATTFLFAIVLGAGFLIPHFY